ncbi:hypothetical protein [Actinomadura nitritigenes]|uniref:hypothetical protein n=1 Tax=Actinomadura nitritigenes TaxID=134602 RepID=UPI003D927F50
MKRPFSPAHVPRSPARFAAGGSHPPPAVHRARAHDRARAVEAGAATAARAVTAKGAAT